MQNRIIKDLRTFEGGLNQDDDLHVVPNGDYVDANNVNISPQGNRGVVVNSKGNSLKTNSLPSGTNTVIGSTKDKNQNSIIYFVYNDTAANCRIFEYYYATNSFITLYQGASLNFSTDPEYAIQAKVVNNYLIWTDGLNPIRKLDLDIARTEEGDRSWRIYFGKWDVIDFTNNTIDQTAFINGTSYTIQNNPGSPATLYTFSVSTDYANIGTAIQAFADGFNGAGTNYTAQAFDDYVLITQNTTTTDLVVGDITVGGTVPAGSYPKCWVVPHNYIYDYDDVKNLEYVRRMPISEPTWTSDYYNEQALTDERMQLAPVNEKALEFAWSFTFFDGSESVISSLSRLKPSTYIDGDKIPTQTHLIVNCIDDLIATTEYDFLRDLKYINLFFREGNTGTYKKWKTVSQGVLYPNSSDSSNIGFYFTANSTGAAISTDEQTKYFESFPKLARSLEAIPVQNGTVNAFGGLTENYDYKPISAYAEVGFTDFQDSSVSAIYRSEAKYFKRGSRYKLGVKWIDQFGRTFGVATNDSLDVYIPRVTEETNLSRPGVVGTPNTYEREGAYLKWYIDNDSDNIPDWAHAYQICITENLTYSWFKQFMPKRVRLYDKVTQTYNTSMPIFGREHEVRIDISELEDDFGDAYTYAEGDRIRLIKYYDSTATYSYADDTTLDRHADFSIKGTDGDYLIIDASENNANSIFSDAIFTNPTSANQRVLLEIYRKSNASENVFYEIGPVYSVTNAGTGSRSLPTSNSVTQYNYGDVGAVTIFSFLQSPDGSASNYINSESYETMNRLITSQDWNKDKGRISVYLPTSKEQQYKTTIRLTGQISNDSDINELFTFSSADKQVLPNEFGWVRSLITNGDILLALHENSRTVSMYLGKVSSVDSSGNVLVNYSDQIIGSRNVLQGEYGTQHPLTVVERNGAIYWVDAKQQAVVQYASNGLFSISDIKMRSFFESNLATVYNNVKMIAGFDEQYEQYIITGAWSGGTIAYNVARKRWDSFYSYSPENMVNVNNRLFSFKQGQVYEHNNNEADYSTYYGTRYDYYIKPPFNKEPYAVKLAKSISLADDNLWVCPTIETPEGQETEINSGHLELHEGIYYSYIPFDKNTPNLTTDEGWVNGDPIRSTVVTVKIQGSLTTKAELRYATLESVPSNRI